MICRCTIRPDALYVCSIKTANVHRQTNTVSMKKESTADFFLQLGEQNLTWARASLASYFFSLSPSFSFFCPANQLTFMRRVAGNKSFYWDGLSEDGKAHHSFI